MLSSIELHGGRYLTAALGWKLMLRDSGISGRDVREMRIRRRIVNDKTKTINKHKYKYA